MGHEIITPPKQFLRSDPADVQRLHDYTSNLRIDVGTLSADKLVQSFSTKAASILVVDALSQARKAGSGTADFFDTVADGLTEGTVTIQPHLDTPTQFEIAREPLDLEGVDPTELIRDLGRRMHIGRFPIDNNLSTQAAGFHAMQWLSDARDEGYKLAGGKGPAKNQMRNMGQYTILVEPSSQELPPVEHTVFLQRVETDMFFATLLPEALPGDERIKTGKGFTSALEQGKSVTLISTATPR